MDTFLLVIFGVVALAIVWLIFVYNGLITFRNRTQEAWSDIDVQLKRRYDLIPNLVETVKGYAGHDRIIWSAGCIGFFNFTLERRLLWKLRKRHQ